MNITPPLITARGSVHTAPPFVAQRGAVALAKAAGMLPMASPKLGVKHLQEILFREKARLVGLEEMLPKQLSPKVAATIKGKIADTQDYIKKVEGFLSAKGGL